MGLPSRPVHVPLGLPIDQAGRREHIEVGAANLNNVNIRLSERGAAETRLGFSGLERTRVGPWGGLRPVANRTTGNRVGSFRGDIYTIDGGELDLRDPVQPMTYSLDRVPEVGVTSRTLSASLSPLNSQSALSVLDIVEHNGCVATATVVKTAAGTYTARIGIETSDGVVLRQAELFGLTPGAGFPIVQLGYVGNYIIALHGAMDSATINLSRIDASTPSTVATGGWSLVGSVATDHIATNNAPAFQFSAHTLEDRIAFAYVNNSGGASRLTVKTADHTGLLETATVNTSSALPLMVGVEGSNADTLWVTWNETTTVKLRGLTGNSLATVKAATGSIITLLDGSPQFIGAVYVVSDATAGTGRILANDGNDIAIQVRAFITSGATATASGSQYTIYNARARQRPFRFGGRFYGLFEPGDTVDGGALTAAILCDWTNVATLNLQFLRPVANLFPGLVRAIGGVQIHPLIGDTTVSYSVEVTRSAVGSSPELAKLDFADTGRWRSAEYKDGISLSGGVLSYIDGKRVPEVAYLHSPPKPTVALGAGTLTGTFSYVTTYEQVDGQGNWCLSGVSAPSSIVLAAQGATLTVLPLSLTNRVQAKNDDSLRVTVYRTNSTGLAPYYYLADYPNDTSAPVSFTDTLADVDLTDNRLLYGTGNLPGTNGAAQDRRAPPYASHVVNYGSMLVMASGSDLWWSGQDVSGEGTWFSPAFQVPIGEPITGLAVMDGTLYAFTKRRIYATAGETPSDNGAQGGLGTPRRLASDVGCINGNSIAVTSAGIFFQSARGIELLNRGGAVQWIGEQVQDSLAAYPYVTSAVLDDRNDLVRITLAVGAEGLSPFTNDGRIGSAVEGKTIAFDLTINAWVSEDDIRGSYATQAAQDAAMIMVDDESRYAWLAADGTVYVEKLADASDAYLDGTSFVVPEIELPLWKMGLQQEQRAYEFTLLFERHSAAGITIEFAHNFDGYVTAEPDKPWTEAETLGKRQLPFRPKPRGSAIGMRIRATAPAVPGTGRGFSFIGLSSDIAPVQGPTRGTSRLPSADRR